MIRSVYSLLGAIGTFLVISLSAVAQQSGNECTNCLCVPDSIFSEPLQLIIHFDMWPEESSWEIRTSDDQLVHSTDYTNASDEEDQTSQSITDIHLNPANGYLFTFYDNFGDGICCFQGNGSFELRDADDRVIVSDASFGARVSARFCIEGEIIYGCMDSDSHNYNSLASQDDASCETCTDGIKNGDETNVDCGGSKCEPCNCTHDNYTIEEEVLEDMIITAESQINTGQMIGPGINVTLIAGEGIELQCGFEIGQNSTFQARIEGCKN